MLINCTQYGKPGRLAPMIKSSVGTKTVYKDWNTDYVSFIVYRRLYEAHKCV